jgi:imidazolonepropionase-like amidohydrolase
MRALFSLSLAMIACGCSALPAIDTLEIRHATIIDPASGTVTPVLAGTDASDLFVLPGASLQDELVLLVEAGMSEMPPLRAATADATTVLGLEGRGTIRQDARADMLIPRSELLEEITNSRDIEFVILVGALLAP